MWLLSHAISTRRFKFHPRMTYAFPKRKFGSKGKKQSRRAAWFDKYDLLHYDATANSARPSEQGRSGKPHFRRRFFLLILVFCTCAPYPRR